MGTLWKCVCVGVCGLRELAVTPVCSLVHQGRPIKSAWSSNPHSSADKHQVDEPKICDTVDSYEVRCSAVPEKNAFQRKYQWDNPFCQENQVWMPKMRRALCLCVCVFVPAYSCLFMFSFSVHLCNRWMTTMELKSVIPMHGWKTLMVQKQWYTMIFFFFLKNATVGSSPPKTSAFHPLACCFCYAGLCWRAEQTHYAVLGAVRHPGTVPSAADWGL